MLRITRKPDDAKLIEQLSALAAAEWSDEKIIELLRSPQREQFLMMLIKLVLRMAAERHGGVQWSTGE